jgi:hypothetical protein
LMLLFLLQNESDSKDFIVLITREGSKLELWLPLK